MTSHYIIFIVIISLLANPASSRMEGSRPTYQYVSSYESSLTQSQFETTRLFTTSLPTTTSLPSISPSESPSTNNPTTNPTISPTNDPSFRPSVAPSSWPSESPSEPPTKEPTYEPTPKPSSTPTYNRQPQNPLPLHRKGRQQPSQVLSRHMSQPMGQRPSHRQSLPPHRLLNLQHQNPRQLHRENQQH